MKILLAALASVSVLAMSLLDSQAKELRMLTGFPENTVFAREVVVPFMSGVEKATGGEITFNLAGPDAVPVFEQLEPVQAGLFDALFTHPVWHSGTTGVGLSVDGTAPDPKKRRDSGLIDFVDGEYAKLGLKVIAVVPLGSKGFQFVLKEPLGASPALQGRKIRASNSYEPLIAELGGATVIAPQGETYSGLQRGVFDGAGLGLVGVADMKLNEVAGYLAEPAFGQVSLMIFFNLESWNRLTDVQKEAVAAEGRAIEEAAALKFDGLAEAEKALLTTEGGMKITAFPAEDASRLDALMNEAVWQVGRDRSGAVIDEMRDIAREAGLSD